MQNVAKDLVTAAAISIWIGALFGTVGSLVVAVCFLPHPASLCWLTLMVAPYSAFSVISCCF